MQKSLGELVIKMKKIIGFIMLVFTLPGLTITFVKVQGTTYFQGYVEDRLDNTINGATVILADSEETILGFDTTDSSGYYSIGVTLNGNSPYYLSAGKSGFETDTKEVSGGGSNDFFLLDPIKIGVFFWATDAGVETYVDEYKAILEYEGYEKFFKFEDSSDVEADFQTVEDFEYEDDTIFTYVIGHGENIDSHSYTYFKADEGSKVFSNTCRGYMDDWDAERKCLLVDSCKSGDWADDFAASPYLAISSADETHYAYCVYPYSPPHEGDFSHYFFDYIESGHTAVEAYTYACNNIYHTQNPKKQDNSNYVWFDD